MSVITKEMQANISPQQAIDILKEGNDRFIAGESSDRNLLEQASLTADGQFPYAVVLSCIDSRVSSELIFDLGMGDIFSARVAGNIINEDILGSMEFGCKVAGSKAIVVLGHSSCGAVKGACDSVEMGNLTALLKKIEPAVKGETETKENRTSSNSSFVSNVIKINVEKAIQDIRESSPVLKEMEDAGEIKIVGAIHDIKTGKVNFEVG